MKKIKKKVIEFFRNLFARWFGRNEGIAPIPDTDVVDIPMSKEYLEEIESNDKYCVENNYYINNCPNVDALMAMASASVTAQRKGIENIPDEEAIANIIALYNAILVPFIDATGWRKAVTSWLRVVLLNIAVGGASTSQHIPAEAVDFRCYDENGRRIPILEMARKVRDLGLPFDQMILYGTFLHVSHRREGKNRGQVLYHSSYNGERL